MENEEFKYPRRRVMRSFVRGATKFLFSVLTDFHIEGEENFPKEGPLLVAANHFSFVDPVAMVRITPWPMEFLGGFRAPNAPKHRAGRGEALVGSDVEYFQNAANQETQAIVSAEGSRAAVRATSQFKSSRKTRHSSTPVIRASSP